MAAKRIAQSSINWGAMAEKVGEAQRPMFNAFKLKSDQYLRRYVNQLVCENSSLCIVLKYVPHPLYRVLANPEKPPAIDWAYYQSRVSVPGLVDSFKKQYEALQVPYPADKVSAQVDAQEKEAVYMIKYVITMFAISFFILSYILASCYQ